MISIALPIHNMENAGFFLARCLNSIREQTYPEIEVVITDNSPDTELKLIIDLFYDLNIIYHHNTPNPKNGMATNINEAVRRSTGDIIKILFMDDYLAHKESLHVIKESLKDMWIATGCEHDVKGQRLNIHYPTFNYEDKDNYIGSPSVIAFKKGANIFFDEEMTWLLDLDFYKKMFMAHGKPDICNDVNVVIGIHEGQMTNILTDKQKIEEVEYLNNKYC